MALRGNDSAKRLRGSGGSSLSMDSSGWPNCTVFRVEREGEVLSQPEVAPVLTAPTSGGFPFLQHKDSQGTNETEVGR